MTLVLVHGVPETSAIWHAVLDELGRHDVVTLSPPGFGAPVPDGFDPSSDAYRDWLIAELQQFDAPVDLLGHDWGGGHVIRAATARPDLIRRVATDIGGCLHPDYVWHDMAQVWQTPGEGEAAVEAGSAMPTADRVAGLVAAGMTERAAQACAEAGGADMGRCILGLYRSAVQPNMGSWGLEFTDRADRPDAFVVIPHDDTYTGGPELARSTAERMQATPIELPGLGHWWMMQDPVAGAAALATFTG